MARLWDRRLPFREFRKGKPSDHPREWFCYAEVQLFGDMIKLRLVIASPHPSLSPPRGEGVRRTGLRRAEAASAAQAGEGKLACLYLMRGCIGLGRLVHSLLPKTA